MTTKPHIAQAVAREHTRRIHAAAAGFRRGHESRSDRPVAQPAAQSRPVPAAAEDLIAAGSVKP
jgi:hypothetical protein